MVNVYWLLKLPTGCTVGLFNLGLKRTPSVLLPAFKLKDRVPLKFTAAPVSAQLLTMDNPASVVAEIPDALSTTLCVGVSLTVA